MKTRSIRTTRKSLYLFAVIFIAYTLIYMTKNCFSAAMASIVSAGIMTKSETGLISALFYLVYAPAQILGGVAADKFSPSKLLLIGFVGAGISNLLVYFTSSYVAILIIWSFNALIQFGVWPSIFKIVSTELHDAHKMSGIFYIGMASTAGLALSYLLAVFIGNWKNNFLISAIVLFVAAVFFYISYKLVEADMEYRELSPLKPSEKQLPSQTDEEKRPSLMKLITSSGLLLVFLASLIQSMMNLGLKALVPVMLMESYTDLTPAIANALNIILVFAAPIGMFCSRIPIFKKRSSILSIAFWFALSIPMVVTILFIGKLPLFLEICALVIEMICMGAITLFQSYTIKKFEKFGCIGTLSGILNCMAALGIVLANYVFAKIADDFGWGFTTRCWLVLVVVALVLVLCAFPLFERFMKKNGISR